MNWTETQSGDHETQAANRGRLLSRYSIEATPKQIVQTASSGASSSSPLMPIGTQVYVPLLPGRAIEDSIEACRRLAELGCEPTPHLPARRLASRSHLDETLDRFVEAGAQSLLLIAGESSRPEGPFANTLDLLEAGAIERRGLKRIGFAGHPESHPMVDAAELDRAIDAKADWAAETGVEIWLTTQFVFEADAIVGWEMRLRERGVRTPVHVGLPGPAKIRTLLSYAMSCGVAASARMLAARPSAARLLSRWAPDAALNGLERHASLHPDTLLNGVHFFPFGGLQATIEWLSSRPSSAVDAVAR